MMNRPRSSRHFSRFVRRSARRVLCGVLSSVLLFQPILQAGAQGIVADGNAGAQAPGVVAAPNGVPVVNITAPNSSQISHNKYTDFNVGTQGVVLNNSPTAGKSELGGIILGNPNYTSGKDARLIINEVTSANRSHLNGFTEVYGRSADVIVSNPNGLTCDGCGFINTPRATLSTGRPVIGADGSLNGLDVNDGDIAIQGRGADASRIDAFDIISRRVTIEAPVSAGKEINIIAGRNQVDYATRAATAKADDGSTKPTVAIDSRALGGMYAGKIALLSTEKGVGVTMRTDAAAHSGELTLTADGKLVLSGRTSSAGDTSVTSHSSDVVIEQQLGAQGKVAVTAAKSKVTIQKGAVVAGDKGVAITAKDIANAGTTQSQSTVALTAAQKVDNSGTALANERVDVTGTAIVNSGIFQSNGLLYVKGHASVDNSGAIVAPGALSISAPTLRNSGAIQTDAGLSLTGSTLSNTASGKIQARQDLTATLTGAFDNAGLVETAGALSLAASGIDNRAGGILRANKTIDLRSTGAFANAGTLSGIGGLMISATGAVGNSGDLLSGAALSVSGTTLSNAGRLLADGTLNLTGSTLTNTASGKIQSQGDLIALLAGSFWSAGLIETLGDLTLTATTIDHQASGTMRANQALTLRATNSVLANAGMLSGATGIVASATAALANSGTMLSGGDLRLSGTTLANSNRILADGRMVLTGSSLTNTGRLQTQGGIDATLSGGMINAGTIETTGALRITATGIDNRAGASIRAEADSLLASRSTFASSGLTYHYSCI